MYVWKMRLIINYLLMFQLARWENLSLTPPSPAGQQLEKCLWQVFVTCKIKFRIWMTFCLGNKFWCDDKVDIFYDIDTWRWEVVQMKPRCKLDGLHDLVPWTEDRRHDEHHDWRPHRHQGGGGHKVGAGASTANVSCFLDVIVVYDVSPAPIITGWDQMVTVQRSSPRHHHITMLSSYKHYNCQVSTSTTIKTMPLTMCSAWTV